LLRPNTHGNEPGIELPNHPTKLQNMRRSSLTSVMLALCILCAACPALAQAFGLDDVGREAAALAGSPYRAPPALPLSLSALTYDEYRRIQFREPATLWRDAVTPWRVQFFHAGRGFAHAVRLHEVEGGRARALDVPREAFDGDGLPLPATAAIAGLRVLHPLNEPGKWDEVIAFLGASYFRALGGGQVYGASARAVAVDTVGGGGEEFPAHIAFWLERPAIATAPLVIYALLDGPRVAGAYRYAVQPGATTVVDVQARLYLRGPVGTLGLAPLSSMFLAGENQPAGGDFRPEVHDSDGLQVATAEGEWLWRPLTNPAAPFVTSFSGRTPRGFGLMQRDRAFASYEDLEAHYERRPGVWVEPVGDWGPGRVELLQFRTPDETHDNIAAWWRPDQPPPPGQPLALAWRLHWGNTALPRPPGAMVVQTRTGHGWRDGAPRPGEMQLHIDFDGPAKPPPGAVQAIASGNDNVQALRARAQPNAARGGWRVTLDFERIDPKRPVELRAYLRRDDQALSETWTYAIAPEP